MTGGFSVLYLLLVKEASQRNSEVYPHVLLLPEPQLLRTCLAWNTLPTQNSDMKMKRRKLLDTDVHQLFPIFEIKSGLLLLRGGYRDTKLSC